MNQADDMSDSDRPLLVKAELWPGREFRPLSYPITRELIEDYMDTVGDRNPQYQEGSSAEPIAPPGLAAIYARLSYLQDHSMPSGGVLARQEFEFSRAVNVGETLTVRARVRESYVDEKGRNRVNFLIEAKNRSEELVTTIKLFAIWPG